MASKYFQESDQAYLNSVTRDVPGWLQDYASRITVALLNFQQENGVHGSFFEIGVYAGKYLSVLARYALEDNRRLVGLDPLVHFTDDQIRQNIRASSEDSVTLMKGLSSDFNPSELIPLLGERARFVSVDGSHDAVDVLWDLDLAKDVLHPKGIVALDDFLNTQCLGVVEAVCQFLQRKPILVPFLFTSGKLFMATVHHVKEYQDFLDRFAEEDEHTLSANFAGTRKQNKMWGQTEFCGHSVLVM